MIVICVLALVAPVLAVGELNARDPSNPRDFYGMVGRDPWYEYGTNPENHPNQLNKTFLENMVADMADMGVGWIRIEIRAESDVPEGPGPVDWAKHDWFINELAPKYGIKVLALLGSGLIGDEDETYMFHHINDSPDANGRNLYTETFVDHARQVAERYGTNIAAYEILNEPNANQILHWETNGEVKEVDPTIYGRLAIDTYEAIKAVDQNINVVAGSMLYDNFEGNYLHFDWISRVYESRHIEDWHDDHEGYPWDGVSIHPYFLDANQVIEHLFAFRELQSQFDDDNGVWVTEIGYPAQPPRWTSYGIMEPTASEGAQAEFLETIYRRIAVETPFVDRVFWFKYEDFGSGQYANWGLVRLRDADFRYGPDAEPWPRKHAFTVYQQLARPDRVPTHPTPRPPDEGSRVRYFPETGQTLRDPFLRYWEEHGGLSMFGYPKTRVFEVRGRAVQYFERARFEYWPEHAGTRWEVQLGHLGRYVTRDRSFDRDDPPEEPDDDRIFFTQTGQYLGHGFLDYWENNGGLDIFGYPVSPEMPEVNPDDGETYTVQYFERARFEWHPEHAGTEHEVQLGLLGNQVLQSPGWRR